MTVLVFVCLATVVQSSKSYSVNQHGLHGDLRSDLISMFEGDHVLRYFNRLFDGKGISLSLSGDKEVTKLTSYCLLSIVVVLEEKVTLFIIIVWYLWQWSYITT